MQAAQIKRFPWLGVLCGTTYGLIMRLLIPYADYLSNLSGLRYNDHFVLLIVAVHPRPSAILFTDSVLWDVILNDSI
jgi:hypothetical protein